MHYQISEIVCTGCLQCFNPLSAMEVTLLYLNRTRKQCKNISKKHLESFLVPFSTNMQEDENLNWDLLDHLHLFCLPDDRKVMIEYIIAKKGSTDCLTSKDYIEKNNKKNGIYFLKSGNQHISIMFQICIIANPQCA